MRQIKACCDICKKEFNPKHKIKGENIWLIGYMTMKTVRLSTFDYQDICPECAKEVFTLIRRLSGNA